jgi:hypothetical protein
MAFNEAHAERIRHRLARRKNIEMKKMFGCVGCLLNGNTLVGVWKDFLIVWLGPDEGDCTPCRAGREAIAPQPGAG